MGAESTPTTPPTSILITGTYQAGKKRLVAAYAGKPLGDVVVNDQVDWVSQIKATKGSVTILGIPEQYGRSPAFRETNKVVADANAFILMLKPADKERNLKYYYQVIKEHSKGGPVFVLVSYTTETPAKYDHITKFAKSIHAKIDTINPVKLTENNDVEMKKLEIIIQSIVDSCHTTSAPVAASKEASITKSPSNPVVRFFSSIFIKSSVVAAA